MGVRKYTDEQEQLLRELYPVNPTDYVAERLGISLKQCYQKASAMGLHKDREWYSSFLKEQGQKFVAQLKKHQFKKGHVPKNKGQKMSDEMKERMKHTFFPKGHLPHNTLHDGAETIRTDKGGRKYVYVRVSLAKWIPKHILLWKEAHGEIPKGYNVVFKDGNSLNVVLENLELVSNEELMVRNTMHRYPEEVKELIHMKGVLKRKINDVERKNGDSIR